MLDAASYIERNGRRDARRAIVILTDDQTERDRNETAVSRALSRAECVLSALIAPDALHTGSGSNQSMLDQDRLRELFGDMLPRGFSFPALTPRTRSAGTANIARQSGGDSMAVSNAAAFEDTLARIRQRYSLYYYLPEGSQPGDERAVEIALSDAARQQYPGAEVHYRRSIAPGSSGSDDGRPVRV